MVTAPSTPAPVLPSVDPQTPPGVLAALQSLRQASTSKSPASVASAPDSREPSSSLSPPAQDVQDEAAGAEPGQGGVKEENANNEEVNGATSSPGKKEKKPRKPRKKKVVEPIVYEIPDVERLETTFKGRLGYACLNTVLRKEKPSVFCSRTCRIDTIKKEGMDYLKEIGRQNAIDLKKLIEWNAAHNIFFMRVSSEMFPFASHEEYGYTLDYADAELKAAGEAARQHNMRLTTHPGQFTQLGSPKKKVVENAVRDLMYHDDMLTRLGGGKDSVMIIHGGGTYGDKNAAIERLKAEYKKLPESVQARLVLENDEICFSADDLLPICEELNIPFVFDYHHDWINPSSQTPAEMMPRILATWERKGIRCKQHLSEPRRGAETLMERRAHSDRCQRLPDALPDDVDLMIEAKDKEQAVFHLYRIYNLQPVIHESLRPPAKEETTQTAGRKSNKRAKALKEAAEAKAAALEAGQDGMLGDDEDGVAEGLEDPEADLMEDVKDPLHGVDGTARLEEQGDQLVEEASQSTASGTPVASKKRKRMTKKEKEALKAEAANGATGANGATTPTTPSSTPAKKKRMTKKEREALAAATGAQVVDGSNNLKDGDTPAAPPPAKKKRLTKKQKEALEKEQQELDATTMVKAEDSTRDGSTTMDTTDTPASETVSSLPQVPMDVDLKHKSEVDNDESESAPPDAIKSGEPTDAAALGQA